MHANMSEFWIYKEGDKKLLVTKEEHMKWRQLEMATHFVI
jgi:hypothetical protein